MHCDKHSRFLCIELPVCIELPFFVYLGFSLCHRATAATVSVKLYLDMHHCGLWVTRNVAITPINDSTFDALLPLCKVIYFLLLLKLLL